MKVTVLETIEHSADITAEMVEAYLMRRGYRVGARNGGLIFMRRAELDYVTIEPFDLRRAVVFVAYDEDRPPHKVLADIASGK